MALDISISKAFFMALGGIFPALSIGKIGCEALKSIGRNPESASKVFLPMILGMALAESIAIYTLLIIFMNK